MDKTILVIKPIKAPLPADLARLGFFPSYMRKRIKPTIGIKNPKIANPKLELSSETFASDLLSIRAPQLLQYNEVSSTFLPQFLQYIKIYSPLLLSIISILLTDLMNRFSKN